MKTMLRGAAPCRAARSSSMEGFVRPVTTFVAAAVLAVMPFAASSQSSQSLLSLDEAVRIGLKASPRLAAQVAAINAADALVGRASELPDPKLRFGIDNLPVQGDDAFRYDRDFMTMRRIGIAQDLPASAKRQARAARALREHDLQQATLAAQRTVLARDVAAAWLDVYTAEQSARVLDRLNFLSPHAPLQIVHPEGCPCLTKRSYRAGP